MTLPGECNQAIILYVSDGGEQITLSQKRETALAVGNQIVQTRSIQGLPEKWKLRNITVMTVRAGVLYERQIVICSQNNPLFRGDTNVVRISGWLWQITGRHGEVRRGPFATSPP